MILLDIFPVTTDASILFGSYVETSALITLAVLLVVAPLAPLPAEIVTGPD